MPFDDLVVLARRKGFSLLFRDSRCEVIDAETHLPELNPDHDSLYFTSPQAQAFLAALPDRPQKP
jgi:hypothetical protein